MSTTVAAKIIEIARGEVGYHESYSNGHWTNHEKYAHAKGMEDLVWVSDDGQPWCAVFVSWLAIQAGVRDCYPHTASTDIGAAWFKQRHQWSEYPAVPAQIFYGNHGDMYHTGIVIDYDDTYVYTIEGNTNTSGSAEGDGVYKKTHNRRDVTVQGYGYPKGLIVKSADPNFHGVVHADPEPPKPPKEPKPSRAEEAKADLKDVIANLDEASPKRTKLHEAADTLRDVVKDLPVK